MSNIINDMGHPNNLYCAAKGLLPFPLASGQFIGRYCGEERHATVKLPKKRDE